MDINKVRWRQKRLQQFQVSVFGWVFPRIFLNRIKDTINKVEKASAASDHEGNAQIKFS